MNFRIGTWFLTKGGGHREYTMLWEIAANAEETSAKLNTEYERRGVVEKKLRTLAESVALADGLLSTKQPERAQEQLRVALIAARKP